MELTEAQQRARATWAAGDYDTIVEYIWSAGGDLVGRVGVTEGETVLDVACGTGNATIPAAETGADVTGLDITPELLDGGRRRAADAGVEIEWVEGDAEALPFDDGSFDVVLSTFGCMFAPDHQKAAAEIARVVKPGGRIGIAAWTPEGIVLRRPGLVHAATPRGISATHPLGSARACGGAVRGYGRRASLRGGGGRLPIRVDG
jgi:SAM-dependent methyltransferase